MSVSALPTPFASTAPAHWWVVCLCAAWCGTCGQYRPLFDALACAHPGVRFEWVDIEDDADIAGDLDVETFPTLLIADGHRALFLGPLLPQAPVLARLLASLQDAVKGEGGGADAGRGGGMGAVSSTVQEAQGVFERLRAARRS